MTNESLQIKRVDEDRLYDFDFATLGDPAIVLQSGTVLQTNLGRVPGSSDLTLEGSPVPSGSRLQQRIKDGTEGELYRLTAEALDGTGNTLVIFGFIQITDEPLPAELVVGVDSYASLDEADAYWVDRDSVPWCSANSIEKERALREATQYLDATYRWVGDVENSLQALAWPRSWAYDDEGRLQQGIPQKIREALYELASAALSSPLLDTSDLIGDVKREKVGSLEVEYFNGASGGRAFTLVDRLVSSLTLGRSNERRLLRS